MMTGLKLWETDPEKYRAPNQLMKDLIQMQVAMEQRTVDNEERVRSKKRFSKVLSEE